MSMDVRAVVMRIMCVVMFVFVGVLVSVLVAMVVSMVVSMIVIRGFLLRYRGDRGRTPLILLLLSPIGELGGKVSWFRWYICRNKQLLLFVFICSVL